MLRFQLLRNIFNRKYQRFRVIFSIQIFLVILFTIIYYLVSSYLSKDNIQSKFNSIYDCLYLSIITQSTLGYDNIIQEHNFIKNIQILQMISILMLISFI